MVAEKQLVLKQIPTPMTICAALNSYEFDSVVFIFEDSDSKFNDQKIQQHLKGIFPPLRLINCGERPPSLVSSQPCLYVKDHLIHLHLTPLPRHLFLLNCYFTIHDGSQTSHLNESDHLAWMEMLKSISPFYFLYYPELSAWNVDSKLLCMNDDFIFECKPNQVDHKERFIDFETIRGDSPQQFIHTTDTLCYLKFSKHKSLANTFWVLLHSEKLFTLYFGANDTDRKAGIGLICPLLWGFPTFSKFVQQEILDELPLETCNGNF